MKRVILVATDGSMASMGAMRMARELEAHRGREVHVLGVVEPVPVFDAGFMVALPEVELYESRQEALRHEISSQVEELTGHRDRWSVQVLSGVPGTRIVKTAEELGAEVILMGLGHHRPVDRVFGTETVLKVVQVSHIPVLAVPEDQGELPPSAVLGVDFSPFSLRALEVVKSLLDSPWHLYLCHVMSGMEFLPAISAEWREDYEEELHARLSDLAMGSGIPEGCRVDLQILEGEPSHELLRFAEAKGTEMLVAGSHGHGFVGRLLMGSVSTRLIRRSRVPVLVVPPEEPTAEAMAEDAGEPEAAEEHSWVREMKEFTRANAGRLTTLELTDPQVGSQKCGINYPLWGVTYDPKRNRVEIMLGRSGTVDGHLTHSIPSPEELSVEVGEDGRAEALRIRLKESQILLRIHREGEEDEPGSG